MILSELRASAWKYATLLFAALAVVAVIGCALFRGRADVDRLRADAAVARAQRAEESVRALTAQAKTDRTNLAAANERAAKAQEDKQHVETERDRTIAGLRAGQLRLKARLAAATAPHPAGSDAGIESQTSPGLLPADAEFLLRFAADADKAAIERNEAVEGWEMCRRISDGGAERESR